MIEIAFVAGLVAAPERCEERTLPGFIDVTALQCMMSGHTALAARNHGNPHLRFSQWRCRPVLPGAGDA